MSDKLTTEVYSGVGVGTMDKGNLASVSKVISNADTVNLEGRFTNQRKDSRPGCNAYLPTRGNADLGDGMVEVQIELSGPTP